jgi:PAS domain S-box-containing protein/putative nucleotidyltransferase with HDIG domain
MQHIDQWLSTTLKCIGDAVITTDRDRHVTFMNYAGENLTGWTNEEAIGKDLIKLFTIINEDTRAIIDDPVVKVLADGSTVENESSIMVSREGHDIAISFNASPVQDESGNNTGVVFVFRDITSKKKAEDVSRKTLQKLRNAMNAIIEAMVLTVETRDPYTAGHQRRVTNIARAIANELCLTEDQIDGIRMAGVIHDLGKISIPAEILSRPGKLLPLEYGLIKTHAQVGFDILKSIEFPWPVAEIVYQHHEKIDGSGYPQGLRGDSIHKESRVIAVADVVEAMASHRPYRAALGIEKSLEEITANREILYDKDSVDACVILFTKKDFKL